MKINCFYFILVFSFICQISCNVAEGSIIVSSCNCSLCCYPNGSSLSVYMQWSSDAPEVFFLDITGSPNGTQCSNFIQATEYCQQYDSKTVNNTFYRYMNCSESSSKLGLMTLYGDLNDKSVLNFAINQNGENCLLVVLEGSKNIINFLVLIVFFILVSQF